MSNREPAAFPGGRLTPLHGVVFAVWESGTRGGPSGLIVETAASAGLDVAAVLLALEPALL